MEGKRRRERRKNVIDRVLWKKESDEQKATEMERKSKDERRGENERKRRRKEMKRKDVDF